MQPHNAADLQKSTGLFALTCSSNFRCVYFFVRSGVGGFGRGQDCAQDAGRDQPCRFTAWHHPRGLLCGSRQVRLVLPASHDHLTQCHTSTGKPPFFPVEELLYCVLICSIPGSKNFPGTWSMAATRWRVPRRKLICGFVRKSLTTGRTAATTGSTTDSTYAEWTPSCEVSCDTSHLTHFFGFT